MASIIPIDFALCQAVPLWRNGLGEEALEEALWKNNLIRRFN